ncbi:DUF4177 domain-containing protein [Paenibacillus sp. P26]|nr:DUF4177 domain-containing protein [Paenibacillus sp. P26]UUZ97504.1 DUF4177 domain-containing protein [Paenibacillus sp. P25]
MYEYKFVNVEVSLWSGKSKENHQEIIRQHAAEGWRLNQIFAPPTNASGQTHHMELIFERTVEDRNS